LFEDTGAVSVVVDAINYILSCPKGLLACYFFTHTVSAGEDGK
jgi:hypothetical protein